jgi:hypothetical protein
MTELFGPGKSVADEAMLMAWLMALCARGKVKVSRQGQPYRARPRFGLAFARCSAEKR